jgi:hypothetical protein
MSYTRIVTLTALIIAVASCQDSSAPVTPPVVEPSARPYGNLQITVRNYQGGTPPAGTVVEIVHYWSQTSRMDTIPASGQLDITAIAADRWTLRASSPPNAYWVIRRDTTVDVVANQTTQVRFFVQPVIF